MRRELSEQNLDKGSPANACTVCQTAMGRVAAGPDPEPRPAWQWLRRSAEATEE
ncbi:hypothetical protein ACH4SP_22430 [Streptomyces sp. NPDC021093]|uniref:hypothetical protein n=1 Tax=Streptomyces sp. NPDC021093 TaxID=3365112 RepID=UPI0037B99644